MVFLLGKESNLEKIEILLKPNNRVNKYNVLRLTFALGDGIKQKMACFSYKGISEGCRI